MRRTIALAVMLALAGLAIAAALDDRQLASEVGLPAVRVAADLGAGEQTCREGIVAPAAFDRVRLVVGTFARPGPPLRVMVADQRSGRPVGAGAIVAGYADNSGVEAAVGPVGAGGPLRVCVRNTGPGRVALLGAPPHTPPDDLGDPDLRPLPAVTFVREPPASMLGLVPEAFDRGGLFKLGALGAWTGWLLLGVVALAVPVALACALGAAYASERSSSGRSAGMAPVSERDS